MHTYLLRLLVAAVTFTVGLAISSIPFLHSPRESNYQRRHKCSERYRESVVTVLADVNEPLKVTYIGPSASFQDGDVPMARLLVQNISGRDVGNFSVNYISGWQHGRTRGSGSIQSDLATRGSLLRAGESTVVDLGALQGQIYWAWPSSVEFTDGSNWKSTRDASFQQQ